MPEAMLTLVVPADVAQAVEDILLEHPELVAGFTTAHADGHGLSVRLGGAAEQVSGHAPRLSIQMIGEIERLQAVPAVLRASLPHARLYYWLVPVLESGRLT